MMRMDINIALVTMVRIHLNSTHSTDNTTNTNNNYYTEGEFDWSTMVQSIILGSFYCFYVLSQV